MWLIRAYSAVLKPLFNGSVLVPGVIARQSFDWEHIGVVENFILAVEDGESLSGSLVLVNHLVIVGQEGGLFDDMLVLLYDICVASWQTLVIEQTNLNQSHRADYNIFSQIGNDDLNTSDKRAHLVDKELTWSSQGKYQTGWVRA